MQHLEASNRNEGEQTAGLLLGVQREVAEDVLLMGTGRSRRSRSQAAPLILKQHVGRVSAANSGQNLDRGTEEISGLSAKQIKYPEYIFPESVANPLYAHLNGTFQNNIWATSGETQDTYHFHFKDGLLLRHLHLCLVSAFIATAFVLM